MNKKEVGEIRRRFKLERNNISHIYGCYVNSAKEIVSYIDESVAMLTQEETEKYLSLLRKSLSGTPGAATSCPCPLRQSRSWTATRCVCSLR